MKTNYLQCRVLVLPVVLVVLILIFGTGSTYYSEIPVQKQQMPLRERHKTVQQLPWWDGGECSNRTPIIYDEQVSGHCGRRASALGPGQKVVSMCLYGNNAEYWIGIEDNLKRIQELYPGYTLRLHVEAKLHKEQLCPLLMTYDHLHVCDITDLPSGLGNITSVLAAGWRFAPMGDPQVDVILFRDSDSKIIERESSAVYEWLRSKTTLHVAKDWRFDGSPVPAGIFALRSDLGKMYSMGIEMRLMLNMIRERMFNYMKEHRTFGHDQHGITKFLYPVLRNDMVRHETFNCQKYPGSWPFPTQRNVTEGYIGQRVYRPKQVIMFDLKCPKECRPPNHQEWENC